MLYDDATDTEDMVYLVYGADRFAEFRRTGAGASTYKGVNGAAGIFEHVTGSPDLWIYHDPHGTRTYFFGGNTASNTADWQIWKIVDAAGNTAYVGDASSAATAVTAGYTAEGWIAKAYDGAGRRYCYTYSASPIGGSRRDLTFSDIWGAREAAGPPWESRNGLRAQRARRAPPATVHVKTVGNLNEHRGPQRHSLICVVVVRAATADRTRGNS